MPNLPRSVRAKHRSQAFLNMGETVTYRQRTNTIADVGAGGISSSDTDTSLTALLGEISQTVVANSGGQYRIDDRVFRINAADLPSGETPPTKENIIVFDGVEYSIVGSMRSSCGTVYDVICRDNG